MPIRGMKAMTLADAMRASLASRVLPVWKSRSTLSEWMGAPFPGETRALLLKVKGWGEGVYERQGGAARAIARDPPIM